MQKLIDKVCEGIRNCRDDRTNCDKCPYNKEFDCVKSLLTDCGEAVAVMQERIAIQKENE